MIVDIHSFNNILHRESIRRDELDPHTLDWYTYDNRVTLLNEVKALFETPADEIYVEPAKKTRKKKDDDTNTLSTE